MGWLVKNDDVLVQEVDEELVILNLSTEEYFALNKTARRFWEVALSEESREEVVRLLQIEFGVDRQKISDDLDGIVKGLNERQLAVAKGVAV
jgi:hypothetical protein